jgi:hypothetical protein
MRGLIAVSLDLWVLLNTMVAFAGENRELEAGGWESSLTSGSRPMHWMA